MTDDDLAIVNLNTGGWTHTIAYRPSVAEKIGEAMTPEWERTMRQMIAAANRRPVEQPKPDVGRIVLHPEDYAKLHFVPRSPRPADALDLLTGIAIESDERVPVGYQVLYDRKGNWLGCVPMARKR